MRPVKMELSATKTVCVRCLLLWGGILFLGICHEAEAQKVLSLKTAIAQAKVNNPYLRTLLFDTAAARTDIITAGLKPNPVFNNQSLQLLSPSYFANDTRFYSGKNQQTWFQLTKTFQTGHKRELKIQLANQNVTLTEKNIDEFSRNLFYQVAGKWLDVWLLQRNLRLIREVKANTDTLVNINRVRLRNQVITPTELIRTQALSEQYQLAETNAIQNYRNELLNLSLLIGTSDSLSISDNDSLQLEQFNLTLDSLVQYVAQNRTDVALAKASISTAEANIGLQKALAKPNVDAGVIYNPQNGVQYGGIYLTVPLPLYDRNQGQIQRSQIEQQQAQSNLQAVQTSAGVQVRVAYQAFQTQRRNIRQSEDILAKTQQVLNTVRYAYLKGNTTIIDFLEAQRTFFDTQVALNESYFNLKSSYVNLLYTTGLINTLP